jgi:hypothetical protein
MTDDTIIPFAIPGNPNIIPIPVNLPEMAGFGTEEGGLASMDVTAFLNMRDWVQSACEAKGAKMVGGGIGCGQADIDIELEGCRYNISIRPLPAATQPPPEA